MKRLPFIASDEGSLGVELEFQIIDPKTGHLMSRAKELIRNIKQSRYQDQIKPEIIQSMLEINSSVHFSTKSLYKEFLKMRAFLIDQAKGLNIYFCGGGTHPYQEWASRKIFPTPRFKHISMQQRYLSKRSVCGQHVHIGCKNAEDALYLVHALTRFVPQFIALSASSPFFLEMDTGYHSSRSHLYNLHPLSGVMPYLSTWQEFSNYYYKMRRLGVINTMKDFYWDIKPKPEYGTVEIRVCDTPLTIKKAVLIAAYIQSLSLYLLNEKPFSSAQEQYLIYPYNRFQASRYGFEGDFINPCNLRHTSIGNDIITTIKAIKKYSHRLNNTNLINRLKKDVLDGINDATISRKIYKKTGSLSKVVFQHCALWKKN
jgi:carboxylate-amine ligase